MTKEEIIVGAVREGEVTNKLEISQLNPIQNVGVQSCNPDRLTFRTGLEYTNL